MVKDHPLYIYRAWKNTIPKRLEKGFQPWLKPGPSLFAETPAVGSPMSSFNLWWFTMGGSIPPPPEKKKKNMAPEIPTRRRFNPKLGKKNIMFEIYISKFLGGISPCMLHQFAASPMRNFPKNAPMASHQNPTTGHDTWWRNPHRVKLWLEPWYFQFSDLATKIRGFFFGAENSVFSSWESKV